MKKSIIKQLPLALGVIAVTGIVLTPVVANAVSDTKNTVINATVDPTISMTTSGTVGISLAPGASAVVSSASDTVAISTNNTAGYTLTLSDSNANADLTSGGNTITPHTGTQASPTALATGTWGYRVVGVGGFTAGAYSGETNATGSTSTWAGVPLLASPNTLKTTAATASNDQTLVWYGAKVDATKPTGVYTDTVTYTAVTN